MIGKVGVGGLSFIAGTAASGGNPWVGAATAVVVGGAASSALNSWEKYILKDLGVY